ncbi:MAG: phosphoribosyltransferase family protein [Chloroflexota bacterium]|nr:phosphoribosyltransferase family protein [Chloroflexota bacterium]
MQFHHETLTWDDVDRLIDHLVPQFDVEFDGMVIITRGGVIPGGLLAEALNLKHILTAAVDFPPKTEVDESGLYAWPQFLQFPADELVDDRRLLVVDDVWGSGRTITAVGNRVEAAGGVPYTCVLHFNPYRNLFGNARPDFYAAITDAYIIYPWEIDRGPDRIFRTPIGTG